jgi:hypothetical protein
MLFFDIVAANMHIFHCCSIHCIKAAAKSSLGMVQTTLSWQLLTVFWVHNMPVSSDFALGKKKKSARARSSK